MQHQGTLQNTKGEKVETFFGCVKIRENSTQYKYQEETIRVPYYLLTRYYFVQSQKQKSN